MRKIARIFGYSMVIAALIFEVLWYAILWTNLIRSPYLQGLDFLSSYTAGSVAASYGGQNVYDKQIQTEIQKNLLGEDFIAERLIPFNHPPVLLPLLYGLAALNYYSAYFLWAIISIGLYAVILFCIWRYLLRPALPKNQQLFLILCSALFYPIFVSIIKGQDTIWVLLGVSLWWIGYKKGSDVLAGSGLALCVLRPQLALFFGLPYLVKNKKTGWIFVIGIVVFFIYSILMVGFNGAVDYLSVLQLASSNGVSINQREMVNLIGLLLRLLPEISQIWVKWIGWMVFLSALAGMCIWWRIRKKDITSVEMGVLVICGLFFSPHLHFHDLGLLLPVSLLFVTEYRVENIRWTHWVSYLILVFSLLLLLGDLGPSGSLNLNPYIMMAALLVGFGWLSRRNRMVETHAA